MSPWCCCWLALLLVDQFTSEIGQRLTTVAMVLTLGIGVWSIRNTRIWFRTGIGFVVAILLAALVGLFVDHAGLQLVSPAILLGFFTLTAWLAARQVLFSGPIDWNKIIGSVCIYLLLGLIWAMLYLLISLITPAAFNGLPPAAWYDNFADIVYFSFVSLTTLGFGDISPAAPVARFLVYLEAIVGQFYLAILVASLVGIRISGWQSGGR